MCTHRHYTDDIYFKLSAGFLIARLLKALKCSLLVVAQQPTPLQTLSAPWKVFNTDPSQPNATSFAAKTAKNETESRGDTDTQSRM